MSLSLKDIDSLIWIQFSAVGPQTNQLLASEFPEIMVPPNRKMVIYNVTCSCLSLSNKIIFKSVPSNDIIMVLRLGANETSQQFGLKIEGNTNELIGVDLEKQGEIDLLVGFQFQIVGGS